MDDVEEDYKNEQRYFDSLSRQKPAAEGKVLRLFKGMDCPDSTTCDIVYIDVKTGEEVLRYDGADPANTRFDYGAVPDADTLKKRGYDIQEEIDVSEAVVTHAECAMRMRQSSDDYEDHFDYYDDDN